MTNQPASLTLPISDRDHLKGDPNAPVTLVEYGDYECPYCGRGEQVVQSIQERTGNQVSFVYRHFPLRTSHPHAEMAAEAAEAAGAQGKFWEMHAKLFENYKALEKESIFHYAQDLGLDMDQFRQDMDSHAHADKVRQDFRSGMESGVRGTPTWFINGERYDGAWDVESLLEVVQKPLGVRIKLLSQDFARLAASGGIMLLLFSFLALIWANSPLAGQYDAFLHTKLGITLGGFSFGEGLLEWVNDGLMAIFFFVVGLEIKREITTGELAQPKKAVLPLAAALGGMFVPALVFVAFNGGDPAALSGWAIPMATDIAFTLGILTLLGNRIPLSLKIFFTALAIADDLGGILVIALFYSSGISVPHILAAGVILLALILLNRWRVFSPLPYAVLGVGLWFAFFGSGFHPTIAGVLTAALIPTRSPANLNFLMAQTDTLLNRYDQTDDDPAVQHGGLVRTLQTVLDRMEPPAQRLEHGLQPWTTYLILPIFALANAGIHLADTGPAGSLLPVTLGIVAGMVIGKPLGIMLFSWLAVRLGWAEKPADVTWAQFASASLLAGVGFTMALFITSSAYTDPGYLTAAKIGILAGSAVTAVGGWTLLRITSPSYAGIATGAAAAPAKD